MSAEPTSEPTSAPTATPRPSPTPNADVPVFVPSAPPGGSAEPIVRLHPDLFSATPTPPPSYAPRPSATPAQVPANATLVGVVRVPTVISTNSGSYRVLQAASDTTIQVALMNSSGLLPGTRWIDAQPDGSYWFESVPTNETFVVEARVVRGSQSWKLSALAKVGTGRTEVEVDAASTLVAEKARTASREGTAKLETLSVEKLKSLVTALRLALADLVANDLVDAEAAAEAFDEILQKNATLMSSAREADKSLSAPKLREKREIGSGIFSPEHMAYDAAGNLYIAGLNDHRVWRINAGANSAIVFFENPALKFPHGVAVDQAGNVYVGRRIDLHHSWPENTTGNDTPGKQVFKIAPDGKSHTVLNHTFSSPGGMAVSKDGKTLFVANGNSGELVAYDLQNDTARVLSNAVPYANGVAIDSQNRIYVTHLRYHDGNSDSRLNGWRGAITRINADESVELFYGGNIELTGRDMLEGIVIDAADNLYVTNNWGNSIFKFTPAKIKVDTFMKFNQPTGIAIDAKGNLAVADYVTGTISLLTP